MKISTHWKWGTHWKLMGRNHETQELKELYGVPLCIWNSYKAGFWMQGEQGKEDKVAKESRSKACFLWWFFNVP